MDGETKIYAFTPQYKKCLKCDQITWKKYFQDQEVIFLCENCNTGTKWNHNTILQRMKISSHHLDHLITIFLDQKTYSETDSILKYDFINLGLNRKTILHYFSIFNRIILKHYIQELDSMLFEGELEFDESHLFKEKASFAVHRPYSQSSVWLFGICQRNSKKFIFFPVTSRQEQNLKKIIFRFIKPGSTIYSDCFSCYVNNHVFPRKSKLAPYNYVHYFINHKQEFVSQLFTNIHTNTIESLWKQLKKKIRRDGITTAYVPTIARFFFFRSLNSEEQKKLIINGLLSNHIQDLDDLVSMVMNKF